MIMPDHGDAPSPRPPMSGEQRPWIDLERPRRVRRDVRTSLRRVDPLSRPEQQSTNLRVRRRVRRCDQPLHQFA